MALRVLIAPDKFKGTLTAQAAAQAIARGWHQARPGDPLELLPICDGGDGFGEVMSGLVGAKTLTIKTMDAAHRRCGTHWWWQPKSKTAIIDSAKVIGLAMLPVKKFHPFDLDTYGLGTVLQAAAKQGARHCWVGIGGSATNDGGFGMARALGWKFLDGEGRLITRWTDLESLAELQSPKQKRLFDGLIVAVDVQNPLLGTRGCTRIYGPQKGLRAADFPQAERCLRQLAKVGKKFGGEDVARQPGAGAAGGLGFALRFFLGAEWQPGFELFARTAKLEQRLAAADLVITGEGSIDPSSLMGKGVGELARQCRRRKIPCVGLAGVVKHGQKKTNHFSECHGLTELISAASAKKHAAKWLEKLAANVAKDWADS